MNKYEVLRNCKLCPRKCGTDRLAGDIGYCGMPAGIKLGRAALHFWEEPCISGENGSGAVFFSGCSLGCLYCQNYSISKGNKGIDIDVERLTDIFFELKDKGANNINLVTAAHFAPYVAEAVSCAINKHIGIPFVYNTSAYENTGTLRMFDGLIDIYLPDFKYCNNELAEGFSGAADYPEYARAAVEEMVRQTGPAVFDKETGLMQKGTIVRHLILPGHTEDSKKIIGYLYEKYRNDIYISIMNQYTPVRSDFTYRELNRTLTIREYSKVIDFALELGVENGFIQEGRTMSESFIPEFDGTGV